MEEKINKQINKLICIEPVGDFEQFAIDGFFKRFQISVSIQQAR